MKKLLCGLVLAAAIPSALYAASGPLTIVNEAGLTFGTTYQVNLQNFITPQSAASKLAVQVTWSSANYTAQNFTDGGSSTGSVTFLSQAILALPATDQITVPSTSLILGSPATAQITIVSTNSLAGAGASFTTVISSNVATGSLTIAGQYLLTIGTNWTQGFQSSNTATNLVSAIKTVTGGTYTGTVTASTGVIIACASSSTFCNGFVVTSSTPAAISTGTMTGGYNPAVVTINGDQLIANKDWLVGANVSVTASNLSSTILADFASTLVSTNVAGVVFASATTNGLAGNGYTLASSTVAISTSSVKFSGGANRALTGAYITFNGLNYYNGEQWNDQSNLSTMTAVSIANMLNGFGSIVAATGTASVVFATATVAGANGNTFTLASSTSAMTVSKATFTGGQDAVTVTIHGKTFTAGVDYSTGTTTTDATNLATAVTNSSNTIGVVGAGAGALMTTTSTVDGASTNYSLATNNTNYITLSGALMTGGTNSAVTVGSSTIALPSHGLTRALEVVVSTSSAFAPPAPLKTNTTYFVIVVDANDIQLALTSTGAVAGTSIVLTSSSTGTTAHTTTLTAEPFVQGSASGKWQVSNDGVNWADFLTTQQNVSVSSNTYTAVFPSSTTVQDWGPVDFGWMQYKTVAPTQGGVKLNVILNAKD